VNFSSAASRARNSLSTFSAELFGAARHYPHSVLDEYAAELRIGRRCGDVTEGSQQPQAARSGWAGAAQHPPSGQPVRRGHNLIDHGFRFCRDSVDHVICDSTPVIFVTDNSMVSVIQFL
jgi:hypothetical protein